MFVHCLMTRYNKAYSFEEHEVQNIRRSFTYEPIRTFVSLDFRRIVLLTRIISDTFAETKLIWE